MSYNNLAKYQYFIGNAEMQAASEVDLNDFEGEAPHEMSPETLAWILSIGTGNEEPLPPIEVNTNTTLRELIYGPNYVYES